MGMSIDGHIGVIEDLKSTMSVCMPEPEKTEICTSLSEAVDTMRKYQRIREIAFPLQFCSTDKLEHEAIMKICEVIEDGSENNHHASNT